MIIIAKLNNLQIYNTIINTYGLKDRLPQSTQTSLADIGDTILTAQQFRNALNEFTSALVNKIALTLFRESNYNNEFAEFIRYSMTIGDVIEEIFVSPSVAEDYEPMPIVNNDSIDPNRITIPDVKALYISNETRRKYRVTIFTYQLKKAFTSEYGLQTLIGQIVASLGKGAVLDDRYMFKQVLNSCITTDNENFKISKFPKMYVNNVNNRVMDKDTALNFITNVKNKISDMLKPTGEFNSQGAINMMSLDDVVIFLRKDIATTIQTEVLSTAINMGELDFTPTGYSGKVKIILVEDFGGVEAWKEDGSMKLKLKYDIHGKFQYYYETDENTPYTGDIVYYNNYMDKQPNAKPKYDVACIICDKNLPIIAISEETMTEHYNAEGLYTNYFLHRWIHYGFSGFLNYCVFFERHREAI